MVTLARAEEMAREAGHRARFGLRQRGVQPERECPRLLDALQHGVVQAIIAVEVGKDVTPYQAYVDAIYRALDAGPVVDRTPEPPRRRLSRRVLDPDWSLGRG